MAQTLLLQLLDKQIATDKILEWILNTNSEFEEHKEIFSHNCSSKDFITYFLNFIHEHLSTNDKISDNNQKIRTPRKIEKSQNLQEFERVTKRRSNLFKCDKPRNEELNSSLNTLSYVSQSSMGSDINTSTPKSDKSCSNSGIFMTSPIKSQNYYTPKIKKGHSHSYSSNVCLGDFIVYKKSLCKKKNQKGQNSNSNNPEKKVKRIKPTNLNERQFSSTFENSKNSFNFENCYSSEPNLLKEVQNLRNASLRTEKDKDIIELGCMQIKSPMKMTDEANYLGCNQIQSPIKVTNDRKDLGCHEITAGINLVKINESNDTEMVTRCSNQNEIDPNLVTFKERLDIVIKIYGELFYHNLIINITSEIYFLISLLFVEHFKNQKNSVEDSLSVIFKNINNILYFSTQMLQKTFYFLKAFDKSTLIYLSENQQLKLFLIDFKKKVDLVLSEKIERQTHIYDSMTRLNVCFNSDTDNRLNFPNDASFHAFKKQRDLFYEILSIWENNHLISGWSFSSLNIRVRTLLNLHCEPTNLMHLARLFKGNLLGTCGKNSKEEGVSEKNLSFFSDIPNVDKDKLLLLKNRLVTKQASNGISCVPIFVGYQEFFKDFIVHAGSFVFNRHLCDLLISEILELNDTDFPNAANEDSSEKNIDLETKKMYVSCLRSMRIMAKFLGFIESLPYKSEANRSSEDVTSSLMEMRIKVKPNFDIETVLKNSIETKTLILTIPWIVKYMSVLDGISLKLPYYQNVIKILFFIYKRCDTEYPDYNSHLIKFVLGWLFDLPHFPYDSFFSCSMAWSNSSHDFSVAGIENFSRMTNATPLDEQEIVDQNVLYIFCPYLEEVKKLLVSNNSNNNRVSVRHITPLTAVKFGPEVTRKKIEIQLEEAFFNSQPLSMKRTVEFVSERIASSCIKHVCNSIVYNCKRKCTEELKKILETSSPEDLDIIKQKAKDMSFESFKKLQDECNAEIEQIIKDKLLKSLECLLPMDTLPQTIKVCAGIAKKQCLARTSQWTEVHVVLGILTKEYNDELNKWYNNSSQPIKTKAVFMLPSGGSNRKHNPNTNSSAHMLDKLKDICKDILEHAPGINDDRVLEILNEISSTLSERNDVNELIAISTSNLLEDFALLLVAHYDSILQNENVLRKLVEIWKSVQNENCHLFKNVLCLRNVKLLAQSDRVQNAWSVLARFCAYLLKEDVLRCDNFESQCAGMFRKDLDRESLSNLTHFLKVFVEHYKKCTPGGEDKFTFLIGFLGNYCEDL